MIWRDNIFALTDMAMCYLEGTRLASKWHIGFLCEILKAVQLKQLRNINIIIPPGHTKTFLLTRGFIPYVLGHDQNARCFYVRRKHDLAEHEIGITKRFMVSDVYKDTFKNIQLDKKGDGKFTIFGKRGFVEAKGVEAAITGASADLLICDDIIDAGDSFDVVNKICVNVINGFFTRLRDNEYTSNYGAIFTNQRLHPNDQTAYLREHHDFTEFAIPFIETQSKYYSFGGFSYYREEDEILNPDITTIEKVKQRIGDWDKHDYIKTLFETQYQQNPQFNNNNIIKLEWIEKNYITSLQANVLQWQNRYISCDFANEENKKNDYSVLIVWGVIDNNYYILDIVRKKVGFTEGKRILTDLYFDWNPSVVLIEKAANGAAIAQSLQDGVLKDGRHIKIPIHAIPVSTDKVSRLQPCADVFAMNFVHAIEDANWRKDFVNELVMFPNVKNDDICDAVSLFLNWHRTQRRNFMVARV